MKIDANSSKEAKIKMPYNDCLFTKSPNTEASRVNTEV